MDFRMQLVYKFGLLRNSVEFDESDDNIAIRIKIFNSMLQKFGDQGYSLPQFCFFRHYESETEPYSLQMLSDEAEFLSGDVIEVILREAPTMTETRDPQPLANGEDTTPGNQLRTLSKGSASSIAVTDFTSDDELMVVEEVGPYEEEDQASAEPAKKDILPHDLSVKSYKLPAFCDRCGQMLMGLVKQGLQCKRCTRNFHKRCVYLLRECTPKSPDEHECGCGDNFSSSESIAIQSMETGSAVSGSMHMSVPHHWVVHSYRLPTVCQFCNKLNIDEELREEGYQIVPSAPPLDEDIPGPSGIDLIGLIRQGVRCKDCKYNAHRDCCKKIGDNCQGDMLFIFPNSESNASTIVNEFSVISNSTLEEVEKEAPVSDQMIPVQRLCVSIRRTHRRESKMIKQGWMNVKFDVSEKLGDSPLPMFAVLSSKNLTFYESENPETHYLKDLALNDIHFIEVEAKANEGALFDIHTNSGLINIFPHKRENGEAAESPTAVTDQDWSDAIVQAMMPAYNKEERKYRCGSVKRSTGSSYSGSRKKKAVEQMSEPTIDKRDISEVYQIFIDDMVGSGQFGAVYGAIHRQTGRKAAVKIIKKEQFGQQRRNIENEVKILKRATFPCVVEMLHTFETDGKLFVVMERMHSDMLEMILNSPQGRLDETTAGLLMVQIMFALKYLHSLAIVHCDLKPENVLLSEAHSQPLVKLCDFGYARIIDVNQFRQSMVGTPAYLAPEVISHCNWDRNIDVWAAGVVLYVTLSGTFPFNEDEDICDQINNASFMYPANPWKQINPDAIDMLNHMLVVKPNDRFDVHKSLSHRFLSNRNIMNTLQALEARHSVTISN